MRIRPKNPARASLMIVPFDCFNEECDRTVDVAVEGAGMIKETESTSSLVASPSGDCIYVSASVTSWSDGRPTVEMLPAVELKVVETNTFEGEAKMVTLTVALEAEEVVRTNEIPRRTRKS